MDDVSGRCITIDSYAELDKLSDEEIYKVAHIIAMPKDYAYKKLCEKVLKYYEKK